MLEDFIISNIKQELPYEPNEGQEVLLQKLSRYLVCKEKGKVFLLKGYAGTGKTSMIAAMVRALDKMHQKTMLLAPTGRAAKVISAYSGYPAYTIHKKIYRQKSMAEFSFSLAYNNLNNTIFIVDEASMIANQYGENSNFGSGMLLDDLLKFVFSNETCSLIMIGDNAQLPPVGQEISPALDKQNLEGYGLKVEEHILTQVARQQLESGILYNATRLRKQLADEDVYDFPKFECAKFPDFRKINGEEMLEELERAYQEVGEAETMVVTRSNKRMNLYNQGIRGRILWREEEIDATDRIMVTKNNYFFTQEYEGLEFLANGDIFEVQRVHNEREMYGYRFADASLLSVDYDWEIDVVIWLDTLRTETPESNYVMQKELFNRIAEDYPEITTKKELWKKVMESPYYNALQIKHAYAVTCHKAQGGQWERVFIDQGLINEDMLGSDYYRWLYTAITRAKKQVFLINFPD